MRPMPPINLFDDDIMAMQFSPDADIWQWVVDTIISEDGKLHNPDHIHLTDADIGFLWASVSFSKQMRTVVGQAEQVMFRAGGWQKGRQERQMIDWFGRVPDFVITLAADYCMQCSDVEFCALVEHELYHIAHALDDFGSPKFGLDGLPKLKLRGHDVEEFIGVVRRYGASEQVKQMVEAAQAKPEISNLDIRNACGTCLLKLA